MEEPRRNLDELITLYELEPSIRDIFVEGCTDKDIIEWFFKEKQVEDVSIQEIESVNVPYAFINSLALEDNNRGRVIALAFALHGGTKEDLTKRVACIADTDFDSVLEKEYKCPILIFTECTAIEIYLFDPVILSKFLTLVLGGFPYEASIVLSEITEVLTDLFLIRLANQELGFGIEPLPVDKLCEVDGCELKFDLEEYIKRYLHKGLKHAKKAVFEETIGKYREKLSDNPLLHIHGHDFIALLRFYVTKVKKPRKAYDADFFTRSLFGVLEVKHLEDKYLFSELLRRFK